MDSKKIQIKGEICLLRSWKESDEEELLRLANHWEIASNLRDGFPHPYTKEDAKNWIMNAVNQPDKLFVIEYQGHFTGSAGFHLLSDIYRKNAEIGYWIGLPYWGKGIATESIRLLTGYIFRTTDVHRIYAEPFADNTGSRRALEKCHFRAEAYFKENVIKNNILKDSCIYAILKTEWQEYHVPS